MSRSHFLERRTSPIRSIIGGLAVAIALTGLGCGEDGGGAAANTSGTGPATKSEPDPKSGGVATDNKDLMGGIPKKER